MLLWGSKYLEYIPDSELNILQDEQRKLNNETKYWIEPNNESNKNN